MKAKIMQLAQEIKNMGFQIREVEIFDGWADIVINIHRNSDYIDESEFLSRMRKLYYLDNDDRIGVYKDFYRRCRDLSNKCSLEDWEIPNLLIDKKLKKVKKIKRRLREFKEQNKFSVFLSCYVED